MERVESPTHFKGRKIIHVDMDAFYASVEQRDQPELRGKAVAVGGGEHRGVITTASYEARKYGVRSAMPGFKAKQLCPHLIFVPPRFDAYHKVSAEVREIFSEYTDLIEPLSLDEAYLDVTDNKNGIEIATVVAEEIRRKVKERTQLTCSAGVSYCKFIAKIASDINKPDGICVIKPHQAEKFLETLPIRKFFGVGKVTAARMQEMGIHTGADLKKLSKAEMSERFGKMGIFYYDIVRGIDDRAVKPERERKSLGVERTLAQDAAGIEEVKPHLEKVLEKFFLRLDRSGEYGRTLTLKLKTHDFIVLTRSRSFGHHLSDHDEIRMIAYALLEENKDAFTKIRLIGLTTSNFKRDENSDAQLKLF